ncbi:N-acetylmuramoyl-L-alanine amidase [Thomasclavelia sp.]
MVNIRKMLVSESKWDIKCPYQMVPKYIVVHNTANDASANNEINYMITNNSEVSFHFAVDDIEIVQGINEDRNSWHCGDGANGKGNRNGISIEICYSKTGGQRFDKAELNACELISMLMQKYDIPLSNVKRHYDFAPDHKYCPHRTMDYGWDRFLDMINNLMSPKPDEPTQHPVFKVGSIVKFNGIFRVDQVLAEIDSIWCEAITGDGGNSIQAGPLTKCDINGNKTSNQIFSVGDYFYCEEKFVVLAIDIPTKSIKINVGGRNIWVYANSCIELINN